MPALKILNSAVPGAVLPVTNVSNRNDLVLKAQTNSLFQDEYAVRFNTAAFEVPAGSDDVSFYMGLAPVSPGSFTTNPLSIHYKHHLFFQEKMNSPNVGSNQFNMWVKMQDLYFQNRGPQQNNALQEVEMGDEDWPGNLPVLVRANHLFCTYADETLYGRDFIDWKAWPSGTLFLWYELYISLVDRPAAITFPAMNVGLYGTYALMRGF